MGNRLSPAPSTVDRVPDDQVHLVTIAETRQRLRLSSTTIFELIKTGQLRTVKIGRSRRVRSDSIESFIERHSTGGAA